MTKTDEKSNLKLKTFPSIFSSINQLNKPLISQIFDCASSYQSRKKISPFESLSGLNRPTICTIFFENSSRTKYSFLQAAQKLGLNNFDFEVAKSSIKKGENHVETLKMLGYQGVNVAVVRTSDDDFFRNITNDISIKIINGGNGKTEHPTQALLDLYTLEQTSLKPQETTITIVGDIRHSRVAGSLIPLLKAYNYRLILCGPESFIPTDKFHDIPVETNINKAIEYSDIIYSLRVQKERHENDNLFDVDDFQVSLEKINKYNNKILILHPGPVNIGTELTADVLQSKHYQGHLQVENSIYLRMALIEQMCLD